MNTFLSRKSTEAMLEGRVAVGRPNFTSTGLVSSGRFAAANFKKPRFSLGTYGARLADENTRNLCNWRSHDFAINRSSLRPRNEAVVYLELMGFTVEDGNISYNGLAMATHRTLFAIDWLCGNGFTYAAPTRESCAS